MLRLTPERDEHAVEHGSRVVEQVSDLGVGADGVQVPVVAVITQWAHLELTWRTSLE